MISKLEGVRLTSGSPELSRFLVQKALNYCALWPIETRVAMQEFAWVCTNLGVQLVADEAGIWIESIHFNKRRQDENTVRY